MKRDDQGTDSIFAKGLPGTGGDVLKREGDGALRRDEDVEGHKLARGEDGALKRDEDGALRRDDDGALRRDEDVEGHKLARGEGEGYRPIIRDGDGALRRDDDVEGHRMALHEEDAARRDGEPDGLFRTGPSTQGEFTRRGPGENPHGDR